METGRVADVRTGRTCGSGNLVAPRLVLTALHLVADDVPDFAEAAAGPFPAPAVHDDVRVRLPRPTTTAPGLGCELTGFPQVQDQPGGGREVEHVSGRISPATGADAGQFQILIPDAPDAGQGPPRPWAGMSGAAVLCDGLVTAVVIEDAPGWGHHRLVALPVHPLLGDDDFRTAVRDGGEAAVESVELAPLLSPPPAAGPAVRPELSPASMLRAEARPSCRCSTRWTPTAPSPAGRTPCWPRPPPSCTRSAGTIPALVAETLRALGGADGLSVSVEGQAD